ncbi:MAG: hypothetical protein D6681_01465 [Calditrichaeota bacterium]|nr:MAG: hypothetical protein D6681_01465 [Calditrichota bacterium]
MIGMVKAVTSANLGIRSEVSEFIPRLIITEHFPNDGQKIEKLGRIEYYMPYRKKSTGDVPRISKERRWPD